MIWTNLKSSGHLEPADLSKSQKYGNFVDK
jgi:hypothetical protein